MAFDLEMLDAHGGAAAVAWAAQGTKSAQPHRSGVTILAAIAVLAPARVGGRTLPLAVTLGDEDGAGRARKPGQDPPGAAQYDYFRGYLLDLSWLGALPHAGAVDPPRHVQG